VAIILATGLAPIINNPLSSGSATPNLLAINFAVEPCRKTVPIIIVKAKGTSN